MTYKDPADKLSDPMEISLREKGLECLKMDEALKKAAQQAIEVLGKAKKNRKQQNIQPTTKGKICMKS